MSNPSSGNDQKTPGAIPSPYATGGGGVDFETAVGAHYAAMLLTQGLARGLGGNGIVRELRFQRLFEGEAVDDIIVVGHGTHGEVKLAMHVKRDVALTDANPVFDGVLRDCWSTFNSPKFTPVVDRFGLAIGLYNKTISRHFQSVRALARYSPNAIEFLNKVATPGSTNEQQRSFVDLVRNKLVSYAGRAITDDELWDFLRSMVIIHFDFQEAASANYAHTVNDLRTILASGSVAEARNTYSKLIEIVSEAKRNSGALTQEFVVIELTDAGFDILPTVDCRADIEKLAEYGEFILGEIKRDVGGIVLDFSKMGLFR